MNIGIMSLILFISGVFILVYGMLSSTNDDNTSINSSYDTSPFDKVLNDLQDKVADADKMIMELDKFSTHVQDENEKKYKELMLLYKLIDDKEQEITKKQETILKQKEEMEKQEKQRLIEENRRLEQERMVMQTKIVNTSNELPPAKQFFYESPSMISSSVNKASETLKRVSNKTQKNNFDEVIYMYESGKNVDDIAKALGKGKGEIRLMLDLMGKEG